MKVVALDLSASTSGDSKDVSKRALKDSAVCVKTELVEAVVWVAYLIAIFLSLSCKSKVLLPW
jgi:hypothetical protein